MSHLSFKSMGFVILLCILTGIHRDLKVSNRPNNACKSVSKAFSREWLKYEICVNIINTLPFFLVYPNFNHILKIGVCGVT